MTLKFINEWSILAESIADIDNSAFQWDPVFLILLAYLSVQFSSVRRD